MLLMVALAGFVNREMRRAPYRDLKNRVLLRYEVGHPLLIGIFTSEKRASMIRELADVLNRIVRPRDPILAYPNIPMVYYLTRAEPILRNPWPDCLSKTQLIHRSRRILENEGYPRVIVRSLVDMEQDDWEQSSRHKPYTTEKSSELDAMFLGSGHYRLFWKNEAFRIYLRKT